MAYELVSVHGTALAVQTFGDPAHPAVLLIAGSAASMIAWEEEFCDLVAAGGRFVIRFDHRDTGRSVSYPAGAPGYDTEDLVRDTLGLLDVLGLERAHLVGASLGGQLAQLIAINHPERVSSLVLISTSPAALGHADDDLPRPSLQVLCDFADIKLPDWSDQRSMTSYLVELARIRAGTARPFDEGSARRQARLAVEHAADMHASMTNYGLLDHGAPWRRLLHRISAPVLVIHGEADPLFPPDHARAMAGGITGAELLLLPAAGHDLGRQDWAIVVPALLRHTGAERQPAVPGDQP